MNSSAASSTVRAIGPTWASVVVADTGHTGMRPNWPLIAANPVRQPGMRTEPPPSVPSAIEVMPAATEAAAPALDPPGVFSRFQGLRVMPVSGLSPTPLQPNSLVVVLPIRIAPARLALATEGASAAATLSAMQREPKAKRSPPTAIRSFAENGTPCSSPSGSLRITASSAALAAASALSGISRKKALSEACVACAFSNARRVTSIGESSRRAIFAPSSIAVIASNSADMECLPPRTLRPDSITFIRVRDAVPNDIKMLCTTAMKTSLEELAPEFERANGAKLSFAFGPSAKIAKMVADGEANDAAIVTDKGFEELATQGKLEPGSRADIAKSAMALAVQKGAPRPDISSAEKFKQALLAAKSLGMSNPVGGGQSGANLIKIFDKLGIADAMKPKCFYGPGGPAGLIGNYLVRKEVEIGIQQLPELMAVPGIDIVGPLPPEIQVLTVFSAGVSTSANNAEGAKAFVQFLTTPKAKAVMTAKGMDVS